MVQTTQKLGQQKQVRWFTAPGNTHAAQFYADELSLSLCMQEYICSGLQRREICIVIATPENLITLQKGLRRRGVDISNALADSRYITYDAEELLSGFMNDREVDVKHFRQSVMQLVRHVSDAKHRVRIFGEMSALLRQQGNPTALLELERTLDELAHKHNFSLYCAYPVLDERSEYGEVHKKIQESHDYIFYC